MIRPDLPLPLPVDLPARLKRLIEPAAFPQGTNPVDEQPPGVLIVAVDGIGAAEMRPDEIVPRPVLRIVGTALPWPSAYQDAMHLVHGLLVLLFSTHLGPDHGLDQPVHLDRVGAPVDLDQRE